MNHTPPNQKIEVSKLRARRLKQLDQMKKRQMYECFDKNPPSSFDDVYAFFPDVTGDEADHIFKQYQFVRRIKRLLGFHIGPR